MDIKPNGENTHVNMWYIFIQILFVKKVWCKNGLSNQTLDKYWRVPSWSMLYYFKVTNNSHSLSVTTCIRGQQSAESRQPSPFVLPKCKTQVDQRKPKEITNHF